MSLTNKIVACVGKETEALKRDIAWMRRDKDERTDLYVWLDYQCTYPSILRRVENEYYRARRGYNNVVSIPRRITNVVQRARRGWSDDDLWNVDTTIVGLLIDMLEAYQEHAYSYPADTTEEEWQEHIEKILWGLRQYQMFMEHGHELDPKDFSQARKDALAALKQSFDLLGDDLPGIWI